MNVSRSKRSKAKKEPPQTGVEEIDRLALLDPCTLQDYIRGVSAYVRLQSTLGANPKKASQIRLSNALARAAASELEWHLPQLAGRLVTEEKKVAGGLRTAKADISESHSLDGLRLAIELKPINLAVGRAIWNRFGDIRTFAVNIHLKFPFAVVGGVLVIPTYEESGTRAAAVAEQKEIAGSDDAETEENEDAELSSAKPVGIAAGRKQTTHLVERAIERLIRAGGRKSEADAAHLLEGIAVVVYDPDNGSILTDLPKPGSGLRWEDFIRDITTARRVRFED